MVKGNGLISLALCVFVFHFLCSFFRLCFVFVSSEKKSVIIIKSMHSFDCTLLIWYEPSLCAHKHVYAHHATNTKVIESRCMNFRDGCDYIHILTYIYKYKCVPVCVLSLRTASKREKGEFRKGSS